MGGALDNHNVEIYFFDTGFGGIARVTFNVVDPAEDESEETPVPDTGTFTAESGSAETTGVVTAFVGASLVIALLAVRKFLKKK